MKKIINTINEEVNLVESDDESDNDKSNEFFKRLYFLILCI